MRGINARDGERNFRGGGFRAPNIGGVPRSQVPGAPTADIYPG